MKGEIWFEKVWWSYMPCHWKGFAVLSAAALFVVGGSFMLDSVAAYIGNPNSSELPFLILFISTYIWLLRLAKSHS